MKGLVNPFLPFVAAQQISTDPWLLAKQAKLAFHQMAQLAFLRLLQTTWTVAQGNTQEH
jgi:hypothetical protein